MNANGPRWFGLACLALFAISGACVDLTPLSERRVAADTCQGLPLSDRFGPPVRITQVEPGVQRVAIDGTSVYWTDPTRKLIRSAPKQASSAIPANVTATDGVPGDLFADGTWLWWAQDEGVFLLDKGGKPAVAFSTARVARILDVGVSVAVLFEWGGTGDFVYLFDKPPGTLSIEIARLDMLSTALAYDGAAFYFQQKGGIYRCALGETPELLFPDVPAQDMLFGDGSLYVLVAGVVRKYLPVVGAVPTEFGSGLVSPARIAQDQDALYVTTSGLASGEGSVVRIDKATGTKSVVAAALAGPRGIAVDATGVYWVQAGDGSVMRAPRLP